MIHSKSLPSQHTHARHLLPAIVLFGAGVFALAGCASRSGPVAPVAAIDPPAPQVQTVGQTLRADPRFTHYVDLLDFAGLSSALDSATDVTVFAPTNAAFDRTDPSWRVRAMPQGGGVNNNADTIKRQALLRQTGLQGVHPASDFTGKLQDVRAINGTIFHVDGRTPGVMTISTGPTAAGFGYPKSRGRSASAELPPLNAKDGVIYPVDGILVLN